MTIELSAEQKQFVVDEVAKGHFATEAEVLSAALDGMRDAKALAWLREAIDEGDASGIYQGDVFADIRKELGISAD